MNLRAALALAVPTSFALVLLLLRHIDQPSAPLASTGVMPPRREGSALGGTPEGASMVRIIDGDTLDIRGRRVRLFGIDAPERGQLCQRRSGPYHCGEEAARHLRAVVGSRPVDCVEHSKDRNGRSVAVCFAGETDIARSMVEAGWAVAARRFSTNYVPAEEEAHRRGVGLWAGPFDRPEDWRSHH